MRVGRLPSLGDLTLAAAVTALMIGGSIAEAHPTGHATTSQLRNLHAHQPGGAYALVALAGAALIVRRRWPVAVLTVTVALIAAYAAAGYVPGAALCGIYVALFTVGTARARTETLSAAGAAIVVLFVATGAGGPFGWLGGTNTVMVACCVAAVAVGLAMAGRRQLFAATVERAERAERDREDEARRRVDAERLRIARELHDVVAHSMSMINVQAGVAVHVMASRPEEAARALAAIKDASREGLQELRAILNVLRQVDDDVGGGERAPAPRLAQLDALAAATTEAGLPIQVSVVGAANALSPAMELAVYRIVQESLTNVLRHAGPGARAEVEVAVIDGKVSVGVTDDGRGSARPDYHDGSGTGIAGMQERTAAFGGSLEAGPRPGGGWRVRAELPLTVVGTEGVGTEGVAPEGVAPEGVRP
jgi:signal transduction histidine kinase